MEVKEGEIAAVRFAVPYLMDDEKAKVEGLRAAIKAGWDEANGQAGEVDAKTAEFASLFGDLSYSPRLSTYKDEARQLGGEWALRKSRLAIESAAWEPKVELLDATASALRGRGGLSRSGEDPAGLRGERPARGDALRAEGGEGPGRRGHRQGLGVLRERAHAFDAVSGRRADDGLRVRGDDPEGLPGEDEGRRARGANDADLKTVFGPWIMAGQRFYGLRDQVMAGKPARSWRATSRRGERERRRVSRRAPLALQPAPGSRVVSVQPKGAGKPIAVAAAVGEKLLFAQDGFASFGKIGGPARVSDLVLKGLIGKSIIVGRSDGTDLACKLRGFDAADIAVVEADGTVLGIPRAEVDTVRLDSSSSSKAASARPARGWDRPLAPLYVRRRPTRFPAHGSLRRMWFQDLAIGDASAWMY